MQKLKSFFSKYFQSIKKIKFFPTIFEYNAWEYKDKLAFWTAWIGAIPTVISIFYALISFIFFTPPEDEIKQKLDFNSQRLNLSLDSVQKQYSDVKDVLGDVNGYKYDYSELVKTIKVLDYLYNSTDSYEIDISPYEYKNKNIGVFVLTEILNNKIGKVINLNLHLTKDQKKGLSIYNVLKDVEGPMGFQIEFDNCTTDNLFKGYRVIPMTFVPSAFEDFNKEENELEMLKKGGYSSRLATYYNLEIKCNSNDLNNFYDAKSGSIFGRFYIDCVRIMVGGEAYYRIIPYSLYKKEAIKAGLSVPE
ncbi:hypothetical protein GCM10027035_47720 [Emticicia sediminis]